MATLASATLALPHAAPGGALAPPWVALPPGAVATSTSNASASRASRAVHAGAEQRLPRSRHASQLIDYTPSEYVGPLNACGQQELDVLMDTVESQLTMCCRRGVCHETPGWRLWGRYTCADFVRYNVCTEGRYADRYQWLYRWSWYFNFPNHNCCQCGKTEPTSEAFDCGREEKNYCVRLQPLGAAVCIKDCNDMWGVACKRWTELHGDECPACNAEDVWWWAQGDATKVSAAYDAGGIPAASEAISENVKELNKNVAGKVHDYRNVGGGTSQGFTASALGDPNEHQILPPDIGANGG